MASQDIPLIIAKDIPLIIAKDQEKEHDKDGMYAGSEVMLTAVDKNTKTNYSTIKKDGRVLLPGDELMTREEVPLYPTYIYVLYYLSIFLTPVILGYLSYEFAEGVVVEDYIIGMVGSFFGILALGWFIGAIFYNLCGMPSNYTRKIGHLFGFVMPIIAAGGLNAFVEDSDGGDSFGGGGVNPDAAFQNIILDVLWAAWMSQGFVFVMIRPNRMLSNYLCGNTRSKNPLRWINCCENTIDAFERHEDRPNHLLWLNTQFILYWFFLFLLSFWWNDLDSGVQVLIPTFISGLGDGLAEPVGVKWGRNCFGIDNTYRTHGCCTKHDYTRSLAGSSMVLLSGYLGVGLAYSEYTQWQFIIAMLIVPPIGCIVEAKAPHTLDNPFIALITGVVATSILYIEW